MLATDCTTKEIMSRSSQLTGVVKTAQVQFFDGIAFAQACSFLVVLKIKEH